MTFIRPDWTENIYNAKHIKSIKLRGEPEKCVTVIKFIDDEVITIDGCVNFERLTDPRTVIPAQPGYMFLNYLERGGTNGSEYIEKLPVIAWAIDPFGEEYATVPITVDGMPPGSSTDWGVLQPGGLVICRAAAIYENEEAWLKHVRAKYKKENVA